MRQLFHKLPAGNLSFTVSISVSVSITATATAMTRATATATTLSALSSLRQTIISFSCCLFRVSHSLCEKSLKLDKKCPNSRISRTCLLAYVLWETVKKLGHVWEKPLISAKLSSSDWLNNELMSITCVVPDSWCNHIKGADYLWQLPWADGSRK